jgi:NitT/TauT family transport system substrate-binding protein/sulfonate transport system substrate-binding protein
MFSRRMILALLPGGLAATTATTRAIASPARTLRIGYQKGEPTLVAAKQNRSLEDALNPLGIAVEWFEFPFGPPLLEAMRVGSVDFGGVGDTPPIFAQAARANLLYVAALPAGASAILVPPGSTLQTLYDLKGKKLAFARGSSAHNLAVVAVEKAGLTWGDIEPTALAPSDAAAAFERGSIDAWSIWDPYFALYESRPGVRVLASSTDIVAQNSFYIASHAFVTANPAVIAKTIDALTKVANWASAHRTEVAALLTAGTGVSLAAEQSAVARNPLKILPMDDSFVASQQQEADRFHALGLIPIAITVRDQVWRVNT